MKGRGARSLDGAGRRVGRGAGVVLAALAVLVAGCASLTIVVPPRLSMVAGAPYEAVFQVEGAQTPVGGVDVVEGELPPGMAIALDSEARRFSIRGTPSRPGRFEIEIRAWTYGTNFPGEVASAEVLIVVSE